MPQMPHIRLLTPAEGDGYNDLMENGPKYQAPPPVDVQIRMNAEAGIGDVGSTPPPPATGPAPLAPPSTAVPPTVLPMPGAVPGQPNENSGTVPGPLTPNSSRDVIPPAVPGTPPGAATSPPQARLSPKPKRDSGVQQAAFQAPTSPADSDISAVPVQVRSAPGDTLPDGNPIPPIINDDDVPTRVDINAGPIGRPNITPEEMAEVNKTRASFASVLSPAFVEFNQATTTGLAADSKPYVVNPAQALQLGLMNSRAYQFRIENMYLQSLTLTLNRFAFQPQFYAGLSPQTGVAGGGTLGGGVNQYVYRTKQFPGGPYSTLNMSEVAGVGKLFSMGGRLVLGFANSMLFNFSGQHVIQPTVNSTLPMTFVQPFLRGGGRGDAGADHSGRTYAALRDSCLCPVPAGVLREHPGECAV